jgi:vancomycin permeability regulator SanA
MARRGWFAVLGIAVLVMFIFLPQFLLIIHFRPAIHNQLGIMPAKEYGVVFGAYVERDHALSDAALERVEAAVRMYHQNRIRKLFISGDNRSNEQAEVIARYAQSRGVSGEDIIVDGLGIDTHDTCRHFADVASEGILITQEYHLPRAMYMCERDGVEVIGMAVNRLGILDRRGENAAAVYRTRVSRFLRESALSWLF